MGNKMSFILDYNHYLDNIEKLSTIDDISMYEKFKCQSKNGNLTLTEGLIKTHPLKTSVDIIKRRFPGLIVEIEKDGEIYIEGDMLKLKNYFPLFNNLGYFISTYTINGIDWIKDFDDNTKPSALYLEPKYDIKVENIPKILYHASPLKYKNKILKIGFIPKTGNKLSKHPDRIYLTDNLNTAFYFGQNIKKEQGDGFCLWEIMGNCVHNLYSDINLRKGGYYTLGNISQTCFKLIKEIE
jgi:hypothetical protein